MAALKEWQPTMTGSGNPERLDGQSVSASYFRVLGVPPMLGRDFDASDDRVNGPKVTILSYRLWQRGFNGDSAIVGRGIRLDDNLYTVVGVMPRGFENVLAPTAELWSPLQYDASLPLDGREWGHHLRWVGRLRAGVSQEQSKREMDAIARAPVREFTRPPWAAMQRGLMLNSLQDDITRGVRPALVAVLGAVLLLLVIACVNVMNRCWRAGRSGAGNSRCVRRWGREECA